MGVEPGSKDAGDLYQPDHVNVADLYRPEDDLMFEGCGLLSVKEHSNKDTELIPSTQDPRVLSSEATQTHEANEEILPELSGGNEVSKTPAQPRSKYRGLIRRLLYVCTFLHGYCFHYPGSQCAVLVMLGASVMYWTLLQVGDILVQDTKSRL